MFDFKFSGILHLFVSKFDFQCYDLLCVLYSLFVVSLPTTVGFNDFVMGSFVKKHPANMQITKFSLVRRKCQTLVMTLTEETF